MEKKEQEYKNALIWVVKGNTGMSSLAMLAVMTGVECGYYHHPHDASDFGRCYELLTYVPEWRDRINEMRKASKIWSNLVDDWDILGRHYEQKEWRKLNSKISDCKNIGELDDIIY